MVHGVSQRLLTLNFQFQDGVYRVFPGASSTVSTPPTPFADRQTLEAELKALEKDYKASNVKRPNSDYSYVDGGWYFHFEDPLEEVFNLLRRSMYSWNGKG